MALKPNIVTLTIRQLGGNVVGGETSLQQRAIGWLPAESSPGNELAWKCSQDAGKFRL